MDATRMIFALIEHWTIMESGVQIIAPPNVKKEKSLTRFCVKILTDACNKLIANQVMAEEFLENDNYGENF